MPDLIHSLQSSDLGHLRIIASFWGIELTSPEPVEALQELSTAMLDAQFLEEMIESLPPEANQVLEALLLEKRRIPWQDFSRRFGKLREVGAGRRDREKIYRNPVSPVEVLFFRGLIGRAFFEAQSGLLEFAYIPDDLIPLLPLEGKPAIEEPGRLANPGERKLPQIGSDTILDDSCTLLASLRMGWLSLPGGTELSVPRYVLLEFLGAVGFIGEAEEPEFLPG